MKLSNISFFLILLMLMILSSVSHSTENQDIYKNHPKLYEKFIKAKEFNDLHYGRPHLLIEAKGLIDEILNEDKNFVPAYIELARVVLGGGYISSTNYQGGTLETAYQILIKAAEIDPDYGNTYVLLGYVFILADQYEAASEVLNKASLLNADSPWLENNKASVLYKKNKYQQAKIEYEKIEARGPGYTLSSRNSYVDALYWLMKLTRLNNDSKRLVELGKKMTNSAHPEHAYAWSNAANVLCGDGFFDLGLEYSQKALSIMEYGVAKRMVALCLYGKWADSTKAGNVEDAEKYFTAASRINPNIGEYVSFFSKTDKRTSYLIPIFNKKINEIENQKK